DEEEAGAHGERCQVRSARAERGGCGPRWLHPRGSCPAGMTTTFAAPEKPGAPQNGTRRVRTGGLGPRTPVVKVGSGAAIGFLTRPRNDPDRGGVWLSKPPKSHVVSFGVNSIDYNYL